MLIPYFNSPNGASIGLSVERKSNWYTIYNIWLVLPLRVYCTDCFINNYTTFTEFITTMISDGPLPKLSFDGMRNQMYTNSFNRLPAGCNRYYQWTKFSMRKSVHILMQMVQAQWTMHWTAMSYRGIFGWVRCSYPVVADTEWLHGAGDPTKQAAIRTSKDTECMPLFHNPTKYSWIPNPHMVVSFSLPPKMLHLA